MTREEFPDSPSLPNPRIDLQQSSPLFAAAQDPRVVKLIFLKKFVDLIVFRAGSVIVAYCAQQSLLSLLYALVFADAAFLVQGPSRVLSTLRPHGHVAELFCYTATTVACLPIACAVSWLSSVQLIRGRELLLQDRRMAIAVSLPIALQHLRSSSVPPGGSPSRPNSPPASHRSKLPPGLLDEEEENSTARRPIQRKQLSSLLYESESMDPEAERLSLVTVSSDEDDDDDERDDTDEEENSNLLQVPTAGGGMSARSNGKQSVMSALLEDLGRKAGIEPEQVPLTPLFLKLVLLRYAVAAAPALPMWSAPGMVSATFLLLNHALPPRPAALHDATPWLLMTLTSGMAVGLVVLVNAMLEHRRYYDKESVILPSYIDHVGDSLLFHLAFVLAMTGDILLEHLGGGVLNHTKIVVRVCGLAGLFIAAVLLRALWLDDTSVPRLTRCAGVVTRRFAGWTLCFLAAWATRDAVVDMWMRLAGREQWHEEHRLASGLLTASVCTLIFGGFNLVLALGESPPGGNNAANSNGGGSEKHHHHHGPTHDKLKVRVLKLVEQTNGTVMGWSWSNALDAGTSNLRIRVANRLSRPGSSALNYGIVPIFLASVILIVLSVGFAFALLQETRVAALRSVGGAGDESRDLSTATFNAVNWAATDVHGAGGHDFHHDAHHHHHHAHDFQPLDHHHGDALQISHNFYHL